MFVGLVQQILLTAVQSVYNENGLLPYFIAFLSSNIQLINRGCTVVFTPHPPHLLAYRLCWCAVENISII